jgi:hypothetical protein
MLWARARFYFYSRLRQIFTFVATPGLSALTFENVPGEHFAAGENSFVGEGSNKGGGVLVNLSNFDRI